MKNIFNVSMRGRKMLAYPVGTIVIATFAVASGAMAQTNATFNATSGGTSSTPLSYNVASSWTPQTVPNGTGATANFTTTATEYVGLNGAITLGTFNLTNNSSGVFTLLNGTGTGLTFSASSGNAALTISGTGTAVNQFGSSSTNETTSLTSTLDITINDTAVTTSTGALQINGGLSGMGGIIKDGAGTFSFATTPKTYTGSTVINAGVLRTSAAGEASNTTSVSVTSGATLELSPSSGTPGVQFGTSSAIVVTLNGAGTTTIGGATLTSGTGALRNDGNPGTLSNNISLATDSTINTVTALTLNGIVSNNGGLVKIGTSSLTLTNTNTYSGATTINAGTLTAAGASGASLGGTSGVAINSTGTLAMGATNQFNATTPAPVTFTGATGTNNGATFKVAGFSQGSTTTVGVGTLTLTASSIANVLNFGSTSGVITFASFVPNGATLTISGYSGNAAGGGSDQLIFKEDEMANLSNFDFGLGAGVNVSEVNLGGGFYEIVAVPEPATVLGGFLLVGALGWHQRRRLVGVAGLLRNARAA